MAKPLMVVVEQDENYLMPLELKLVETLREAADIELISDEGYFREYFSSLRRKDILVIDEDMYTPELHMHAVGKTYVLTEDASRQSRPEEFAGEVVHIYKFLNLNAIVGRIVPDQWENGGLETKETRVISVLSPAGGAGCTTIALGVGAVLGQNMKRVLYVNPQMYQTFHFYLGNKATLPVDACAKLRSGGSAAIKPYLVREGIWYLPPLKSSREAMGVEASAYVELVDQLRRTNEYDFIIVDIGSELTSGMLGFLEYSFRVYVVTRQDAYSAFKMEAFRHNVNCSDKEKYFLVCNCFEKDKKNGLLGADGKQPMVIQHNVSLAAEGALDSWEELAEVKDIQKLGLLLI